MNIHLFLFRLFLQLQRVSQIFQLEELGSLGSTRRVRRMKHDVKLALERTENHAMTTIRFENQVFLLLPRTQHHRELPGSFWPFHPG